MTNAEHIQMLSKWDLAEFIYNVSNNATEITTCKEECKKCEYSDSYCTFQIAEWLNQQIGTENGNYLEELEQAEAEEEERLYEESMDSKTRVELLPCGTCEDMIGCETCLFTKEAKDIYQQIRAEAIDELVNLMKPCNNCPSYPNECNDTDYFEDCCRTEQSISWEDLRLKAEQLKEQTE